MNTKKIKTTILTLATTAIATFGLAACDKGTEPGETNVGRGDIVEEGSLVGEEGENISRYDTANASMEEHYDHADHENHDVNEEEGYGDGAYDGPGDGIDRGDVQ
ncbi:hypothetical protein [Pontibacter pamirensis]|uniref:hypothetical protein n=1 Tax=Pontibacter pamirensis TaxID=2562824 RepID=UPI001389DF59|nr:hypothetical protein [Pontibacter pamirensis]